MSRARACLEYTEYILTEALRRTGAPHALGNLRSRSAAATEPTATSGRRDPHPHSITGGAARRSMYRGARSPAYIEILLFFVSPTVERYLTTFRLASTLAFDLQINRALIIIYRKIVNFRLSFRN